MMCNIKKLFQGFSKLNLNIVYELQICLLKYKTENICYLKVKFLLNIS